MPVSLREGRAFDRTDPVARYWLAHCVGFGVTGGASGEVEAIAWDGNPHEPETLLVRGRHRVRRLPASAVAAVVPHRQLLVVERSPGAVRRGGRAAGRVTGRTSVAGARLGLRALLHATVLALALSRRAWAVAAPLLATGGRRAWLLSRVWSRRLAVAAAARARTGGKEAARLIRSVPWQRSARSARSATTRLWQARSRISSRLRTTSSPPSSETASQPEAGTTSST